MSNGIWITNTAISAWQGTLASAQASFDTMAQVYLPITFHNFCWLAYAEDFSDPQTGWYVGDNEYVLAQVINGEYQVVSRQAYLFLFRAPACAHPNYVIEADMRWEGTPGSDMGLVFGIVGNFSQYYFVDINTDLQAYVVYRRNWNGSFSLVVAPAQTSAIMPGSGVNHLGIVKIGSHVNFGINGQHVASWDDSTISGPTSLGLAMAPYEAQVEADVRFDNFQVTYLGGEATLADLGWTPREESRPLGTRWQPLLPETALPNEANR
jgi:hypothetical protein